MKNSRSADFCADRIDVITKFAVITNAARKRVHCICMVGATVLVLYLRAHAAWSDGAMVLGKLPVPGRPTDLD